MSLSLILPLWLVVAGGADGTPPAEHPRVPAEEVRRVVAGIVGAAEENAAKAERLDGDRLLDYYVRKAAALARQDHLSPRVFLAALGVALDHGDLLRNNPVMGVYLAQVETAEARQRRLRVLGAPTLRGRRDWVQHFAVSAALTALLDPATAESIGVAKEYWDALGTSGFSFADLAADYAGVAFAQRLLQDKENGALLRTVAEHFRGDEFLPASVKELEDGLPWAQFRRQYGDSRDSRFQRHCAAVRRQVLESPGFRQLESK